MAEPSEAPRIFVSYRRSESGTAGRIFDRLVAHFGEHNVFIDIDNIPFGVDFRRHIGEALRPGDLLLAIVGKNWVGPRTAGKNRINDETDPVRVEIETALKRDINLLPVLVDDASMPAAEELPESIKAFAYRNAAEVEPGRDFHFHVDRLIRSIDGMLAGRLSTDASRKTSTEASAAQGPRRVFRPRNLAIGLAGLAAVALIAAVFSEGGRLSVESGDSNAVEASRSSREQSSSDAALTAWNVVKDTESATVLEAFIARFGDSFYADLAKAKLAALKTKEESPLPTGASRQVSTKGYDGSHYVEAQFDRGPEGNWIETHAADPAVHFVFAEQKNTRSELLLHDDLRDLYLRFDFVKKRLFFRQGDGAWVPFYQIVDVRR
jgi:hypothetical protein